jgi:hypothetical protein
VLEGSLQGGRARPSLGPVGWPRSAALHRRCCELNSELLASCAHGSGGGSHHEPWAQYAFAAGPASRRDQGAVSLRGATLAHHVRRCKKIDNRGILGFGTARQKMVLE